VVACRKWSRVTDLEPRHLPQRAGSRVCEAQRAARHPPDPGEARALDSSLGV